MNWKVITRSMIGTHHQNNSQPCQDYSAYVTEKGFLIGAIADGAGSAELSHIGAKEAVTFMINYFQKFVNKSIILVNKNKSNLSLDTYILPKTKIKSLFYNSIQRLRKHLEKIAMKNNCLIEDLACTLILFIASEKGIYAMQIGDGFLIINSPEEDYKLVFPPHRGEYHNETLFITSDNAKKLMQTEIINGNYSFICASTDGLESVALKLPNYTPFAPFFQPLKEYLFQTENPEKEDEYLITFLNSDRLNSRTNDDKTLLLALQCACSISG